MACSTSFLTHTPLSLLVDPGSPSLSTKMHASNESIKTKSGGSKVRQCVDRFIHICYSILGAVDKVPRNIDLLFLAYEAIHLYYIISSPSSYISFILRQITASNYSCVIFDTWPQY